MILGDHYGYYRNIWAIRPYDLDTFAKIFFGMQVVYGLVIGMIKITIMFLYLRIFSLCKRITLCVWVTQFVNVSTIIIFLVGLFFACQPLSFYWAHASPVTGTCPDPVDKGGVTPGLNISLDVWMIVLPLFHVWNMKMGWKDKLGVIGMFSLGFL